MTSSAATIPVIDIAPAGPEAQARVARELVAAAVEHGFVYVKNSDDIIPADAVDRAFALGRRLFAAPVAEKQKCTIQKNNRGWSGMNYETLDPKHQRVGDFKEAFNFGQFVNGKADQPLPDSIAPYESQINDFFDYCYHLSLKINHLLGVGLAARPPTFFRDRHLRERGATGNILRFLYYPPLADLLLTTTSSGEEEVAAPAPTTDDVRAGAHSDYGSITLLFRLRGQAGLEIDTSSGSSSSSSTTTTRWAPVPVCPPGTEDDPSPPVLVNIGDLLSYWTNGLLRSTVHRVVFPPACNAAATTAAVPPGEEEKTADDDEARYSIAFFCHPVGTTTLDVVPSERVQKHQHQHHHHRDEEEDRQQGSKAITADEHLQMRLQASYLKLYEEKDKS